MCTVARPQRRLLLLLLFLLLLGQQPHPAVLAQPDDDEPSQEDNLAPHGEYEQHDSPFQGEYEQDYASSSNIAAQGADEAKEFDIPANPPPQCRDGGCPAVFEFNTTDGGEEADFFFPRREQPQHASTWNETADPSGGTTVVRFRDPANGDDEDATNHGRRLNVFLPNNRAIIQTNLTFPETAVGLFRGCTASLVGPDLVITSSACLDFTENGTLDDANFYSYFRSGVRNHTYIAATMPQIISANRAEGWALIKLQKSIGQETGWLGLLWNAPSTYLSNSPKLRMISYSPDYCSADSGCLPTRQTCNTMGLAPNKVFVRHACDTVRGSEGSVLISNANAVALVHYGSLGNDINKVLKKYTPANANIAVTSLSFQAAYYSILVIGGVIKSPTTKPSRRSPTKRPTKYPSSRPSKPTPRAPTGKPSTTPPSLRPSLLPTGSPSLSPTTVAPQASTTVPSSSLAPTANPTTGRPTHRPAAKPTDSPRAG